MLQVYYAEGEYLHDVKALAVATPWRRHWQLGIRGLTYCSESMVSHQLAVPSALCPLFFPCKIHMLGSTDAVVPPMRARGPQRTHSDR